MESLFNTSAGFLTDSIIKIPNRRFMPNSLVQVACTGNNLNYLGCKTNSINAGSINFTYEDTLKGALGEFVERYSSALYNNDNFRVSSYNELLNRKENALHPNVLKYYSTLQYEALSAENIFPLMEDDLTEWVKAFDYINNTYIYIPAFTVYMPYHSKFNSLHNYMKGATSTGLAAGNNLKNAVQSVSFECAERHAFSKLLYRQIELSVPRYTSELICTSYKYNKRIQELYANKKVRIKVFDLSTITNVETTITFLYFEYKDNIYQSLAAVSRFSKLEALIKAGLEAYQGIEYATSLDEKNRLPDQVDFNSIDDFDKHFHFYNKYPEFRNESALLQQALDFTDGEKTIYYRARETMCNNFSNDEIRKNNLPHLIYIDITPVDVSQINYSVARVITPTWNLLTGIFNFPFLGNSLENHNNLLTQLPHPFP